MINKFEDLLSYANEQEDAQRLLFLFAKTNESRKSRKRDEKSGTLDAVMCVDKLPEEIKDFEHLSLEADSVSKGWDLVLVAGLSGKGDVPPTSDEAEPYLNQMANDLASGQNIARYVVFDRSNQALNMQAS